jgi:hypothetical protein
MVLQQLHIVMNGVERVIVFDKMLGKFGSVAVGSKCVFVFVKPYCEAPSGLTHIRFLTIGACEFAYA